MDISTPSVARPIDEFSQSQVRLFRESLAIGDFPFQPNKTYIIFDAIAGDNDLHVDIGAVLTYSILRGDSSNALSFTDSGGTKIINYEIAGRYLITIDGNFQGINTSGASQATKDKYINLVGGTNYPTTIPALAFNNCVNLERVKFDNVDTLETSCFLSCISLREIYFPNVTTLNDWSIFKSCSTLKKVYIPKITVVENFMFDGCVELEHIDLPSVTLIGDDGFENCNSLVTAIFPSATRINNGAFGNCKSLINIHIPNVTLIEDFGFTGVLGNDALQHLNLLSTTSIGASCFANRDSVTKVDIKYSAGISVGLNAFQNISLSDLYVKGAASAIEAGTVETKLITAGMTQLSGYRLLY